MLGQLGIVLAAAGEVDLSGAIWDDTLPEFNNYIYHYQLRHQRIVLQTL